MLMGAVATRIRVKGLSTYTKPDFLLVGLSALRDSPPVQSDFCKTGHDPLIYVMVGIRPSNERTPRNHSVPKETVISHCLATCAVFEEFVHLHPCTFPATAGRVSDMQWKFLLG